MSNVKRVSGMIIPRGLKQMNTTELGKICDYFYNTIKPKFPNEYPEDVYGIIYKTLKHYI